MNIKKEKENVNNINKQNTCCNGYVYYDGRMGDDPIYMHNGIIA